MARRKSHDYADFAPIDSHYVKQEITETSAPQVRDTLKEVPFLITASELQERKIKRRKRHNAPRP